MYALMRLDDVSTVNDLLEFTRQKFGCPSFRKDEMIFKAQARIFFDRNPEYTPRDMAKVVVWAKEVRKRPRNLSAIFYYAKDAFAVGVLPPRSEHERKQITDAMYQALEVETDPEWRHRLTAATTTAARRDALDAWHQARGSSLYEPGTTSPAATIEQKPLFA